MGRKHKDYSEYIGKRFGELTILSISEPIKEKNFVRYCNCKCSCGKETTPFLSSVLRGRTTSCGHVNTDRRIASCIQNPNCLITNKSTGIKNISFDRRRHYYVVTIVRNGVKYREYTYSLTEAIKIKERILQDLGELD